MNSLASKTTTKNNLAAQLQQIGLCAIPQNLDDFLARGTKARWSLYMRFYRLFSGCRSQIQTATVEIDRVDEILFVPESSSGVFHPLDLRVERFAGRVGNLMP